MGENFVNLACILDGSLFKWYSSLEYVYELLSYKLITGGSLSWKKSLRKLVVPKSFCCCIVPRMSLLLVDRVAELDIL